jgi:hypothetical protein
MNLKTVKDPTIMGPSFLVIIFLYIFKLGFKRKFLALPVLFTMPEMRYSLNSENNL